MAKIHQLDQKTISQIAAGEVIERPVSVVKELIENSIDANATMIDVHLLEGGKKRIEVVDNGSGIDREDIPIAFQRYTTSKLTKIEDLDALQSMGFRGEALASIAAVSKIELITKTENSETATYSKIVDGKIQEIKEIGAPSGTKIIVHDLFYNLPARKKHLRSDETETMHILELVGHIALCWTTVKFRLTNNGDELLRTSGSGNLIQTLEEIYNLRISREMREFNESRPTMSVHGYCTTAVIQRQNPEFVLFFVNRRKIFSRSLLRAIMEGYENLLPRSKYPVAIVFIEIDPKLIDVNIHPTKSQVKFLNEESVWYLIRDAVRKTVLSKPEPRSLSEQKIFTVEKKNTIVSGETSIESLERESKLVHDDIKILTGGRPTVSPLRVDTLSSYTSTDDASTDHKQPVRSDQRPAGEYRIIGQMNDTYILLETPDGLMIVDQHVASERKLYETLLKKSKNDFERQMLITSIILNLNKPDALKVKKYQFQLKKLGFEIEEFGDNTFRVTSIPVVLGRYATESSIRAIIEELSDTTLDKFQYDELAKLLACKSAVKAGEKLDYKTMVTLIEELNSCDNRMSCPHGRPSCIIITKSRLEKEFGRDYHK